MLPLALFAKLTGTYTIGPSGNYMSFTAAVSAHTSSGVSGPVIFNIAGWKTITGQDSNSVSIDPMFYSNTNLHVSNPLFNNLGTPITAVADDIDGEPRDSISPDIGADEFALSKDKRPNAIEINQMIFTV